MNQEGLRTKASEILLSSATAQIWRRAANPRVVGIAVPYLDSLEASVRRRSDRALRLRSESGNPARQVVGPRHLCRMPCGGTHKARVHSELLTSTV